MDLQKIYGLRDSWGLTAVLQLIYEPREKLLQDGKEGTGIEGSTRGPREPKEGEGAIWWLMMPILQSDAIFHF